MPSRYASRVKQPVSRFVEFGRWKSDYARSVRKQEQGFRHVAQPKMQTVSVNGIGISTKMQMLQENKDQ